MSSPHANDAQQQPPQPQPQYAPPQYVQQQTSQPQWSHDQQAQPYGQPQQFDPQQAWQPAPMTARSDFNALGLVALLIVLAVVVVWGFASPFVMRGISMAATATYDSGLYALLRWLNVIVVTPLYLLALLFGILGAKSRQRPRGRVLAYLAIGAAGAGLVGTLASIVATNAAYGLFF